jgi:hypothetical protein
MGNECTPFLRFLGRPAIDRAAEIERNACIPLDACGRTARYRETEPVGVGITLVPAPIQTRLPYRGAAGA